MARDSTCNTRLICSEFSSACTAVRNLKAPAWASRLSVGAIMKTPISIAQDNHYTPIQFSHALNAAVETPSALTSPVQLQSFRVPWAPLQTAARETQAPDAAAPGPQLSLAAWPETLLAAPSQIKLLSSTGQ